VRDEVLIYINGTEHRVRGADAFLSLSDYLRGRAGLVGTKIVCSEGDCGACSVLLGRPHDARIHYRAVDSCILFLYQLHCTHVVTVEGLARNGALNAVQEAMVLNFGSQCGFCTPGFVVTMTGLFENAGPRRSERLTEDELRTALSGNLCRCTGYVQILEAGKSIEPSMLPRVSDLYPDAPMLDRFAAAQDDELLITARVRGAERTVHVPRTIDAAAAFKAKHNDAKVVSGATDFGVQYNKGLIDPERILCLTSVAALDDVKVEDGRLVIGARATWSKVEAAVADTLPDYCRILRRFGGPQIRNAGTIGGNIINASPIADSAPFHFVMEAELELVSPSGPRRVPITRFHTGYKKLDMRADELLARVFVPLPREGETLRLYKISRRQDLDISTFTAGILMKLNGRTIEWARVAFGGVAPVVLRLPKTEAFLCGQPFTEATMEHAGRIASGEVTPISDVRGSADFRTQLAANILLKFYHEQAEQSFEEEAEPCLP
jgi:xanthine dehydrogenase small subunit